MTILIAPDEVREATASGPSRPRLRLRKAGGAERTVELSAGKVTIGSSSRCQVCLPATEAQPLQCLLSLEAGVATVTRWATGVLLNGREFSKGTLKAGDRLSIGPWEIEWDSGVQNPRAPEKRDATEPTPQLIKQKAAEPVAPTHAAERLTVDFAPTAVVAPVRETKTTPPLVSPGAPAPLVAPTPAPVAKVVVKPTEPVAPRPAAKTVLVSSRQTDPFADLLGPAKPIAAVRTEPAPAIRESLVLARPYTSQAFEDQLVVSLWTASFASRRRAKSLVAALKSARRRIGELTTAVSQVEGLLQTARAAKDAYEAESKEKLSALQSELAEAVAARDRLTAELETLRNARVKTLPPDPRLKTLSDSLAAAERDAAELREQLTTSVQQIESLRAQSAAAEAARTAAEQQLAAERCAQQQVVDDPSAASEHVQAQWEAQRKAWERERLTADQEAARLREQLYAAESQIEPLRQQVVEADAARVAVAEQLDALQRQQKQWLAECQTLEQIRAADLAEVVAERDELRRQVDGLNIASSADAYVEPEVPASPATPNWETPFAEPPRDETTFGESSFDQSTFDDPAADDEGFPAGAFDAAPVDEIVDEVPGQPATFQWGAVQDQGDDESQFVASNAYEETAEEQSEAETETPQWNASPAAGYGEPSEPIAREPEPAHAITQAEPEPALPAETAHVPVSFIDKYRHLLEDDNEPAPPLRNSRPILDEEYLSPSKNISEPLPEDDSDEALEAYMSNMMRRVRGDGAPASGGAASSPKSASSARLAAILPGAALEPVEDEAPAEVEPPAFDEPEIEVDANGMLRLARKPHAATNLSALRELANTSARTAIAHHRQRRHFESAVTKSLICVVASGLSAYLIWSSPDVSSPWFWGGCGTLLAAALMGFQLLGIFWQRRRERGPRPAPVASHVDFSSLTQPADEAGNE